MHSVDALGASNFLDEIINLIKLIKVEIDVLENLRHLLLECIDELLFLVVGAVAVHVVSGFVDLFELILGLLKALSKVLSFLFKDLGCIIHVLENKSLVQFFHKVINLIKLCLGVHNFHSQISDFGDDLNIIRAHDIFLSISLELALSSGFVTLLLLDDLHEVADLGNEFLDLRLSLLRAIIGVVSSLEVLELVVDQVVLLFQLNKLVASHLDVDRDLAVINFLGNFSNGVVDVSSLVQKVVKTEVVQVF